MQKLIDLLPSLALELEALPLLTNIWASLF